MKKINKKVLCIGVILLIIIGFTLNIEISKKFIKSYTYVELENRGYNSSDVKNIKIEHSYINKILSYNEWRIAVEFKEVPNIYFWFTYRNKQVIFEGVSSEPMMDKESVIEYSESFKKGKLLFEYGKGTNESNISAEDVLDIINNVFENEGIDENYINSYIDEKTNSVIVEMKDISLDKQEQFINEVFSMRTGSLYIKYIKDNSLIQFIQINNNDINVELLKEKYPEYFEIPYGKGIEIYVWQMADGLYRCGMLMGTNRNKTPEEVEALQFKSLSIEEAKAILYERKISKENWIIIPISQPYSSYLYDIDKEYSEEVQRLFE